MPVIDASVIVELFREGDHAGGVDERLAEEEHTLWAPHLIDAEVGHALRRAVHFREVDAEAAAEALWELDDLPLRRVDHEVLIHVAWDLRDNFSFYDGMYVALALMLDEPLLTFDRRLARAGKRTGVDLPIEVLA
ncbi:MAG TPA: type II toxin-antitoxin system VapC family toxin [Solirubrobacterales bacterium]|nr:type II toxin-antitoxin system VapC family toxin [Solirubrobacterales bacterium]